MVISCSIVHEVVDSAVVSPLVTSKGGFNATEFLAAARRRVNDSLSSARADGKDPVAIKHLPYLLQTTDALISINSAIWEGCQENRSETEDGILPFSRVSIPQLCTQKVDRKTTIFHIPATVTSMDFGPPPPVPKGLSDLLSVPMLPQSSKTVGTLEGFPDYAAYLDRATLLRDEALLPFLVKLKDHLEAVHVFLGNIEAWLMEPYCNAQFLENVFVGISEVNIPDLQKLVVPCGDKGGDRKCCTVQHPQASPCLRCHKPYRDHHRGMSRSGVITHLCDYWSRNVGSFLTTTDYDIQLIQCRPYFTSTGLPLKDKDTTMGTISDNE